MASSSPAVHKKRVKDRLNDLPEAILLQVLSFLDMKEVVEKSLVCKKWRYIWTSVPCLNFNQFCWERITRKKDNTKRKLKFMDFVDRVFLLRDGSIITRLNLSCDIFCDADRIGTWLTIAARRRVKEILLRWSPNSKKEPTRDLVPLVFHTDLTAFNLELYETPSWHPTNLLNMPDTMCLAPLLNTLHLKNAKLPRGDVNGELYLTFPVLGNLILKDCKHDNLNALNIHTAELRNLIIENRYPHWDRDYCGNSSCKIDICAPKLQSLELCGNLYKQYSMRNLVSIQTAKFEFPYYCNVPAQVIQGVYTARSLELVSWLVEPPEYVMEELANPFTNIKCLKLTQLSVASVYALLKLLGTSHGMETLVIHASLASKNGEWEYVLLPSMFPNLKDVTVWMFKVSENELMLFLKHLLKNAAVLQKLTIELVSGCTIRQLEFEEKMRSLPRASSSITVHLQIGYCYPVKFGLA